jgi:PIN domain nuclease of toxin-antitoxin system
MKLLLDTHAWLWFVFGDQQLSVNARSQIQDADNEKYLSPASYWELTIKISLGKYTLHAPYRQFIRQAIFGNGFKILHISPWHTETVASLPYHHRDPFDRLLIAQTLCEEFSIVSNEAIFDHYGVHRIW